MEYTIVLREDREDGGFVAEVPALPGCISDGETVGDALVNVREAIEAYLESLAMEGVPMPPAPIFRELTIDPSPA